MKILTRITKMYISVRYNLFKMLPKSMWPVLIKATMRLELGEHINLKSPKTFNEKIQWLKLYDTRSLKSKLADKYAVREWVKENIGEKYLIPLIGVWDRIEDIDFNKMPNKFVLKATHGCGCNIIVPDKTAFDEKQARELFNRWFKTNYAYYTGELQYEKITPKVIAEEYLENDSGDLHDYKVFCFNGCAKYIMYLCNRKKGLKMAFYDANWNKQPFTYTYPQMEEDVEKPICLSELLDLAEKLSKEFATARVDFYILNDGSIKFGEITMASAGGNCRWNPPDYNAILGDMIILPDHPLSN